MSPRWKNWLLTEGREKWSQPCHHQWSCCRNSGQLGSLVIHNTTIVTQSLHIAVFIQKTKCMYFLRHLIRLSRSKRNMLNFAGVLQKVCSRMHLSGSWLHEPAESGERSTRKAGGTVSSRMSATLPIPFSPCYLMGLDTGAWKLWCPDLRTAPSPVLSDSWNSHLFHTAFREVLPHILPRYLIWLFHYCILINFALLCIYYDFARLWFYSNLAAFIVAFIISVLYCLPWDLHVNKEFHCTLVFMAIN